MSKTGLSMEFKSSCTSYGTTTKTLFSSKWKIQTSKLNECIYPTTSPQAVAQSAGAVECTDCISTEG